MAGSVTYKARILRFEKMGEKTGWFYVEIPNTLAAELLPGERRSFRVKGFLDAYPVEHLALLPMGDGNFIIPFNQEHRKGTGKTEGDEITLNLEHDPREPELNAELMLCLEDDPVALQFFSNLPKGHRRYFSNWINDAKTDATRSRRLSMAVSALAQGMGYGEMIRANKGSR